MGVVPGDFNEDGLMDILVYYWGRSPVIFLRKKTAGVQPGKPAALSPPILSPVELSTNGERWFSNGAVTADFDGDGHVDVLIGNYFADGAHILDANAGGVESYTDPFTISSVRSYPRPATFFRVSTWSISSLEITFSSKRFLYLLYVISASDICCRASSSAFNASL